MTQPNPDLWDKFIEAVMSHRISGMSAKEVGVWVELHIEPERAAVQSKSHRLMSVSNVDHLCAELRRWMLNHSPDMFWGMDCASLSLFEPRFTEHNEPYPHQEMFTNESELDRHLAAALWVLERER